MFPTQQTFTKDLMVRGTMLGAADKAEDGKRETDSYCPFV